MQQENLVNEELDDLRRKLQFCNIHKLAEVTGLQPTTIYRIRDGKFEGKFTTIRKLQIAINKHLES